MPTKNGHSFFSSGILSTKTLISNLLYCAVTRATGTLCCMFAHRPNYLTCFLIFPLSTTFKANNFVIVVLYSVCNTLFFIGCATLNVELRILKINKLSASFPLACMTHSLWVSMKQFVNHCVHRRFIRELLIKQLVIKCNGIFLCPSASDALPP